jgi:hypothetical protein
MIIVKKQIAAFVLLLLVAMPMVLLSGLLIKKKIVHYQREERFETEHLQTVIIFAQNPSWVKLEKEILIDGKLFDVKSIKKIGSNLLLTGFFDHKEDKLKKGIVTLVQHENESGNPLSQSAIKFLFFPVFNSQQEIICDAGYWRIVSQSFRRFSEKIPITPARSLIHPPC